jgi:hypothetical protein
MAYCFRVSVHSSSITNHSTIIHDSNTTGSHNLQKKTHLTSLFFTSEVRTRLILLKASSHALRCECKMNNKRNVVLYLDKELVEKTRNLGFNLSKTVENHLKQLITQFSHVNTQNNCENCNIFGSPGVTVPRL